LLLNTALNYEIKWGVIEKNPLSEVRPPKIIKTFHFFSKKEVDKMIEKAPEPLKTAIILYVNTGLRREELFSLRWRDVDLKSKKIRFGPYEKFTPKSKKPRSIPVNSQVEIALNQIDKSSDGNKDYVFRPYKIMYPIYEQFKSLLGALGLKGTLHDLRHTFCYERRSHSGHFRTNGAFRYHDHNDLCPFGARST
jgi:integrase